MSQEALELLLNGVKDQGQRKQITSAYYAFANGDPETFAVQFAVLLRAHAMSLKLLPARLEKAIAAETHKMSGLVLAHQSSVERIVSLFDQVAEKCGGVDVRVDYQTIQVAIEEQLTAHAEVLKSEREKIVLAVAANGRWLEKLTAHRILLGLILSYSAGLMTIPVFQYLIFFLCPLIH